MFFIQGWQVTQVVPPRGIEPLIFRVKGGCVKPIPLRWQVVPLLRLSFDLSGLLPQATYSRCSYEIGGS